MLIIRRNLYTTKNHEFQIEFFADLGPIHLCQLLFYSHSNTFLIWLNANSLASSDVLQTIFILRYVSFIPVLFAANSDSSDLIQ